jgi:hypothetical protein
MYWVQKRWDPQETRVLHLGMYCSVWEIFMSSFQEEFVIICILEDCMATLELSV